MVNGNEVGISHEQQASRDMVLKLAGDLVGGKTEQKDPKKLARMPLQVFDAAAAFEDLVNKDYLKACYPAPNGSDLHKKGQVHFVVERKDEKIVLIAVTGPSPRATTARKSIFMHYGDPNFIAVVPLPNRGRKSTDRFFDKAHHQEVGRRLLTAINQHPGYDLKIS